MTSTRQESPTIQPWAADIDAIVLADARACFPTAEIEVKGRSVSVKFPAVDEDGVERTLSGDLCIDDWFRGARGDFWVDVEHARIMVGMHVRDWFSSSFAVVDALDRAGAPRYVIACLRQPSKYSLLFRLHPETRDVPPARLFSWDQPPDFGDLIHLDLPDLDWPKFNDPDFEARRNAIDERLPRVPLPGPKTAS